VPNIRWLLALITSVHRFLYRLFDGRFVARAGSARILLLTHVGRKSGRTRVTPLLYVPDGERWVIVGSNAGDDRDPAWWGNLQANPECEIQIRGEHHAVKARRASTEESRRLWPDLDASYPYYPAYRERTSREIPIVVLEPRG
jgi:deazaflavin-dependent oxidoreductase (nitroreductase family)